LSQNKKGELIMNKETLQKTLDLLIKEKEEIGTKLIPLEKEKIRLGSDDVWQIENGFYYSKEENFWYKRVSFYAKKNHEISARYDWETKQIDFGWSSISYSSMTTDEHKEAKNYISAVDECLDHLLPTIFDALISAAGEYYLSDILPIHKQRNEITQQIEEVKKEIATIEKNAYLEMVRDFFEKNVETYFYLVHSVDYTKKYSANVIYLRKNKKNEFDLYASAWSIEQNKPDKKNLDDDLLIHIYRAIHKTNFSYQYNQGKKTYYSYPNKTDKDFATIKTIITEEEYYNQWKKTYN
jgi:hypothetical protein